MRPSLLHERRHADGTARRKGSGLDIDVVMRDFVVDCAVEHHSGVHVDSLPCIIFTTTLPTRPSPGASPSSDLAGLSELDGGIRRHEDRDVSAGAPLTISPLNCLRAASWH